MELKLCPKRASVCLSDRNLLFAEPVCGSCDIVRELLLVGLGWLVGWLVGRLVGWVSLVGRIILWGRTGKAQF